MKTYFVTLAFIVASICLSAQTFNTAGTATPIATGEFNMTPTGPCPGIHTAGAIWSTLPISFNSSFSLSFEASMDIAGGAGADGICAVFGQNLVDTSLNGKAGCIGYYNTSIPNVQFQKSFAVEYDDFSNYPNLNDPVTGVDHIMIARDGDPLSTTPGGSAVPMDATGITVKDGSFHDYRIEWCLAATTFKVYFDGALRITSVFDYRTIFTTPGIVHWGFTSGTGASCSNHIIRSIQLLIQEGAYCFPPAGLDNTLQYSTEEIRLTPNPAADEFTICINRVLPANSKLELYDVTGRCLQTHPLSDKTTVIPVTGVEPGIYQCRIITGNEIAVKRLVLVP